MTDTSITDLTVIAFGGSLGALSKQYARSEQQMLHDEQMGAEEVRRLFESTLSGYSSVTLLVHDPCGR